ncbi:ATP-binding protein [Solidesulfovibrio sp.]
MPEGDATQQDHCNATSGTCDRATSAGAAPCPPASGDAEAPGVHAALEACRRRLRLVTRHGPAALLVFDAAGRILEANPAARSRLGLASIHGRQLRLAEVAAARQPGGSLLPDGLADRSGPEAAATETMVEWRLRGPDGAWTPADVLIGGLGGSEAGLFAAVFEDDGEVRDMVAALVEAKEEAEQASRVRAAFLANMSHEIRTPLNGVLGMLQLLEGTPLDAEQNEFVHTALEAGRGLLGVINAILDFSNAEDGSIAMCREVYSPREVLAGVVAAYDRQARAAGIELCFEAGPGVETMACGDAVRLRQVAANLVSNAVKFTPRGSVRVRAERLGEAGETLGLTVADTGIGIPAAHVERIFEPFTQVDGSTTRRYQGTGLGLALVRRLTALLGGTAHLESRPGIGTTVRVAIPLPPAPAQARTAPARVPVPPPRRQRSSGPAGLRVLVVDDESVCGLTAGHLLSHLGHVPVCVASGAEALARLAREPFDVVLMDVCMADMDGLTATRRIRALPGPVGRVPIVALTARVMESDRRAIAAAGMDHFLAKPVDAGELTAVLAEVAGTCSARPEPAG